MVQGRENVLYCLLQYESGNRAHTISGIYRVYRYPVITLLGKCGRVSTFVAKPRNFVAQT